MISILKYSEVDNNAIFARAQSTINVEQIVADIINNVRTNGDKAVYEYCEKFDKAKLSSLLVSEQEIEEAVQSVEPKFLEILEKAASNIRKFHEKQVRNSFIINDENGIVIGQKIIPVDRAGLYVPGGTAAYPSTVLMDSIPAKIAGCKEVVMVTPPSADGKVNPVILAAAKIAGIDKIFKVGGAQAVAALAYGTETIPKVDKIVGPGNIYVAIAKREVFGHVSIDSIAGPSEILIIADESANPTYVAADLLSQAEHDELASAVLITTSKDLAEKVVEKVNEFVEVMPRKKILTESLKHYCAAIVVSNIAEACQLSNAIAPEHLELAVSAPFDVLTQITNAGAIFLGHYTPEPVGDYMAGPNHVLPTSGTARFFSPLGVDDFVKKSSVLSFTRDALLPIGESIVKFAESERLFAHALSVKVRLDEEVK